MSYILQNPADRFARHITSLDDREALNPSRLSTTDLCIDHGSYTNPGYMGDSQWNDAAIRGHRLRPDVPQHTITFKGRDTRRILVALLAAALACLCLLIIAIIICLATGVFVYHRSEKLQTSTTSLWTNPTPISSTAIPPFTVKPFTPIVATQPSYPVSLDSRLFSVTMSILRQANVAYEDQSSYEYRQAQQMLLNAIHLGLETTQIFGWLTDISIIALMNSGEDLQVNYDLRFVVPSPNQLNAAMVRDAILSRIGAIQQAMNGVTINQASLNVVRLTK